jgi:TPR repeat protein
MAARNSALQPSVPNRRRRVRHKIQTPAYASFSAESQGAMLDLHEIVNMSEDGVAIQCNSQLEVDRRINLCLDLAESDGQIYTLGRVVWSNASGLAGLHFSDLSPVSLFRLREWLFLNAMAGAANADDAALAASSAALHLPAPADYTDTLAAVTAVQRQVEALGADLSAALKLIAERSQTLVRASGAAIALAGSDPDFMECRASAGTIAPPVGARLHVGDGFSGECVKSGRLLRCDDSELDSRVDRESCRALGIRSILAVPVRIGDKSIGIIEVLSSEPSAFSENDGRVLQRFADTVIAAVNRAARAENLPPLRPAPVERFAPKPGSVLFASVPKEEDKDKVEDSSEKSSSGIHLPRLYLSLLFCFAAAICGFLGYLLAPMIQSKLQQRGQSHLQTVLASSQAPKVETSGIETASFGQLKQMGENGDPAAENALGLRYFQGDEENQIARDEKEAFRWFSRAAEHGNLAAQAKLGSLYWGGRGVPKDINQAYFWTVLARARGDEQNRDLAAILASGMTRSQAAAIEQQADLWLQQHIASWKPSAGH